MDPLSALSIASSIVQFLDFGIKVTRRLSEYNNASPKDVPKSLQSINAQLPLLINALNRVKTDIEVDKIDVDTRCILRGVVAGCTALVEQVESIISKMAPVPGEAFAVKVRKVLASLKTDEKIWAIDKNLQTYISVLILHHVIEASEVPPTMPEETFYYDVREKRVLPFVERDALLQELDTHLYDAARSQVKSPTIVLLVGEKGVGKTQLALEYCHQAHLLGQFRTVFWINAATTENLCLGLESMAATVRQTTEGSREEKIEYVKKFLGDRWHPWLLVLHHYDQAKVNRVMDFLPTRGYGAIILTTCNRSANSLGKVIEIPKFLTVKERENLRRSLTSAIENKDFETIQLAVARGADVNSLWEGFLCLSRAAIHRLEDAVQLLLARGANPNLRPGCPAPLYWAAGKGNTSIVRILLDHDDSVGFVPTPEDNDSAFHNAVKNGYVDIVRMLLDRREVRIDSKGEYKRTALNEAASGGHAAVVNLLLDRAVGLGKGTEGSIALMEAAKGGYLETVKILCRYGEINPNFQDEDGNTVLCHAAQLCDKWTRKENGEEMVKFLLDSGADPNLPRKGGSPLHEAALRGYENVARLLLEHGADPTKSDYLSCTPLLAAIKYKSENTVSLLLQVEIRDPLARDEYLGAALKYAARKGLRDTTLSVLQVGGVNIDTVDNKGMTLLLLAIEGGHVQTARLLVRRGASQDLPDKDGRFPLILAAEKGHDLLVRDLLRSCKTPNLKNGNEDTPLCLAAANGHEKVVKLLLSHGADPEMANKFGEIPLDLAEERNHEKVVELLTALPTTNADFVMLQKNGPP